MDIPWSSNVQWTFHMSIGHFKCPLDISNVHWIQWTIGHYTHSVYPRCPFPVVTKSGIVHWIQLTLEYPMHIRYVQYMSIGHLSCVHWIQWTVICPMDISYVHWTFALVLDMYELSCHSGNDGLVVRRIY
jgi:hypothetical protein